MASVERISEDLESDTKLKFRLPHNYLLSPKPAMVIQ